MVASSAFLFAMASAGKKYARILIEGRKGTKTKCIWVWKASRGEYLLADPAVEVVHFDCPG